MKDSSYLTGQVAAITFSVQSECILNGNAHILYKYFLGKLWEQVKKSLSLVFSIKTSSEKRLYSTYYCKLELYAVSFPPKLVPVPVLYRVPLESRNTKISQPRQSYKKVPVPYLLNTSILFILMFKV